MDAWGQIMDYSCDVAWVLFLNSVVTVQVCRRLARQVLQVRALHPRTISSGLTMSEKSIISSGSAGHVYAKTP